MKPDRMTILRFIALIGSLLTIAGVLSGLLLAWFYPDRSPATVSDLKEQMRLSEERILLAVGASVEAARANAEARGGRLDPDEEGNYETAVTLLLSSDDPIFHEPKSLIEQGQASEAAEDLVRLATQTSGDARSVPERTRADLLLSAGDIFVPSDPEKALAAYRQALELDPGNPILATRIQRLTEASAAQNAVPVIPDAKFEYGGLLFEFEGCETDGQLNCVLSVINSTPDMVALDVQAVWVINERSRWMEDDERNIRASNRDRWNVPSLGASQIDISFSEPANVLQYLQFALRVNNIGYQKGFRDVAVRGGRAVEVRHLRPFDPAFPDRAFSISDVQFHFLGCTNTDAPSCQVDLTNNGSEAASIKVGKANAYDNESRLQTSVPTRLDIGGPNKGIVPPGITTGWTVNFWQPAGYLQVLELPFELNGEDYSRVFRDLPLAEGDLPQIKSFNADLAILPDGAYRMGGLSFAFRGCANPDAPRCVTDVHNDTDQFVRLDVSRATAVAAGEQVRSSAQKIEMNGRDRASIPPGLTTSVVHEFRDSVSEFDSLTMAYQTGGDSDRRVFDSVAID